MKFKVSILLLFTLFTLSKLFSQSDKFNKDIIQTVIVKYDTICDDLYYHCILTKKWNLENGSLMSMLIYKDTSPVMAYVVTPSKRNYCKGDRLKIGKEYLMSFRKYDSFPSPKYFSHHLDEWGYVQDIMLCNSTISLPLKPLFYSYNDSSSTSYKYQLFYTSMDLNAIKNSSQTDAFQKIKNFNNHYEGILQCINEFVYSISFNNKFPDIIQCMDTLRMKESMSQWGPMTFNKMGKFYRQPKTQLNPYYAPNRKYFWHRFDTFKGSMKRSIFIEIFREMLLKQYKLPINENEEATAEIKNVRLLYAESNCYTISVVWMMNQNLYSVTINVEFINNRWIVTGLKNNGLK